MAHHLNTNKQFMIGNGILAFGVLAVVIIFLYMSFRFKRNAKDPAAKPQGDEECTDAKAQKDQCERVSRFKRARYGDEGAPPKARSSNEC